jgi:hypothetical protein
VTHVNVATSRGTDLNILISYEVRNNDRTKCTRTTKYNPTNE